MEETTVKLELLMTGNLAEGAQEAYQGVTKLDQAVEHTSEAMGKKMASSARRAAEGLKSVGETASSINNEFKNNGKTVENAASRMNMLNYSVQQVIREMPSAAAGFNMFFLAISNNLPILADSIRMTQEYNRKAKAAGEITVPVWKQVVGSIFSWQSAMMLGVTVLSMFGSKIAGWIGQLFKGKAAADEMASSQRTLRDAMNEGTKSAIGETMKLKLLYDRTQDQSAAMSTRLQAVKDLKEQYPGYFSQLGNEAILAGKASDAYRQLTADIIATAQARAMEKRIEQNAARQYEHERGRNADENYLRRNRKEYERLRKKHEAEYNDTSVSIRGTSNVYLKKDEAMFLAEYRERERRLASHNEKMEAMNRENEMLAKRITARQAQVDRYKTGTDTSKSKTKRENKLDSTKDIEELGKMEAEAQERIEDNKVALIEEGYERERAAAARNYEKERARISEEESRRKALVIKLRKSGVTVTATQEKEIALSAATQRQQALELYNKELEAIAHKEKKAGIKKQEEEGKELKQLLDKYQDYNARRIKIEQQYGEDVAKLRAKQTASNAKEVNAAIVQAGKIKEKALREVTEQEMSDMKSSASVMVELFEDSSEKSIGEIERLMKKLEMLKAYMDAMGRGQVNATGTATIKDKADKKARTITAIEIAEMGITPEQLKRLRESPEALKAFMEQWEKLRGKVEKGNPFRALKKAVEDLFNDDGTDRSAKEKKIRKLAIAAADVAGEVGNFAGQLSSMFDAAGNQGLADAMEGIQTVLNGVSGIAKGFAEGGVVGGVMASVGEGINFIGKAFAANARHRAALKQVMADTIAQQREYNLLLMQEALAYEKGSTAFGTDNYGKASNAIGVLKKATEDLAKAQKKAGDIGIVTGHKRTGFLGTGHGRDTYTSILSLYPNLIQANGEFNTSLAETILSNRKMNEEGKAALQNLINLAKEQKEAWKEVSDYFNSIFGEMGNTMTDALVDAFRNGTEAGKTFVGSIGKMLEKLGADMIYSAVLQKYFTKAQAEIDRIAKDGNMDEQMKFAGYASIMDTLAKNVGRDSSKANELLAQFQRAASEYGIDIYSADEKSQRGQSGSLDMLTQAQGTKLEGLMTSAQIHLASMDTHLENVTANLGKSLDTLGRIEEHVRHCEKLDGIAETMEDLKRNGIKVK